MHRNLTPRALIGPTARVALLPIFLTGASCLAGAVTFEPDHATGPSGVASESVLDGPESKGAEDAISAYQPAAPAEPANPAKTDSNLGDKARSVLPEPPTWSLMLFGFLTVAGVAYRRSRKRFVALSPAQEFDRRRFQGRLQTAFSWNESEIGPVADTQESTLRQKLI